MSARGKCSAVSEEEGVLFAEWILKGVVTIWTRWEGAESHTRYSSKKSVPNAQHIQLLHYATRSTTRMCILCVQNICKHTNILWEKGYQWFWNRLLVMQKIWLVFFFNLHSRFVIPSSLKLFATSSLSQVSFLLIFQSKCFDPQRLTGLSRGRWGNTAETVKIPSEDLNLDPSWRILLDTLNSRKGDSCERRKVNWTSATSSVQEWERWVVPAARQ